MKETTVKSPKSREREWRYAPVEGHWDEALWRPGFPRRHWRKLMVALGRMGFKAQPAVPALIERFKDEDEMVCQAAAMALGRVATVADMVRVLGNKEVRVRRWGAFAIGDLRRALGGLHPADASVGLTRDKLRNELKTAVPALVEALQDKNDAVRAEVVLALGAIGPPGQGGCPQDHGAARGPKQAHPQNGGIGLVVDRWPGQGCGANSH